MAAAPTIKADIPGSGPDIEALTALIEEVTAFQQGCEARYRFNSRWDNILNIAGLVLSVGIVAA